MNSAYRDLKPENVLFFEQLGIIKLTDFGFSNKFCPGQKLETSCGSLAYSAPEILLGDSYDAPAVGECAEHFLHFGMPKRAVLRGTIWSIPGENGRLHCGVSTSCWQCDRFQIKKLNET